MKFNFLESIYLDVDNILKKSKQACFFSTALCLLSTVLDQRRICII
jgi:hypothetical protein